MCRTIPGKFPIPRHIYAVQSTCAYTTSSHNFTGVGYTVVAWVENKNHYSCKCFYGGRGGEGDHILCTSSFDKLFSLSKRTNVWQLTRVHTVITEHWRQIKGEGSKITGFNWLSSRLTSNLTHAILLPLPFLHPFPPSVPPPNKHLYCRLHITKS